MKIASAHMDKCFDLLYHHIVFLCTIIHLRWLRVEFPLVIGHPQKSIHLFLSHCISPSAALCNDLNKLLLFFIGFRLQLQYYYFLIMLSIIFFEFFWKFFLTGFSSKIRPFYIINNALIIRLGIPIISPYFMKFKNPYFTSHLLNIFDHIIPARAPTGVRMAPRLDPMIAPNIALYDAPSWRIELNNTDIGMLFSTFANTADVNVYTIPSFHTFRTSNIWFVMHWCFRAKTITNIDRTNGINSSGARFMVDSNGLNFLWVIKR